MSSEFQHLEGYTKQGKSPIEIYKSNQISVLALIIFERCKRYKKIIYLKENMFQEDKNIEEHIQYIEL